MDRRGAVKYYKTVPDSEILNKYSIVLSLSPKLFMQLMTLTMESEILELLFTKQLKKEVTAEEHLEYIQLLQATEMNSDFIKVIEGLNTVPLEMQIADERSEEIWENICRRIKETTGELIG